MLPAPVQDRRLIDADDAQGAVHDGGLRRAGADLPVDRAVQVRAVIGRIEAGPN